MALGTESEGKVILPHELITEILSWLPAESLVRFETVCRLWRDTIQEQHFTHIHMRRYALKYPDIMWEVDTGKPDSETESLTCVSIYHGLLLERCSSTHKYRIRNPLIKNILDIPSPKHNKPIFIYMRFVSKTNEYKLVSYHVDRTTDCSGFEVLTIGTNPTWRPLDLPTNSRNVNHDKVTAPYIDDVLYVLRPSMADDWGVICLDMATEQFKEVPIPSCLFMDWENVKASQSHGTFSITNVVQGELHVWVLEDYKKCKWGDQKIVISLTPLFLKDHPKFREYGSIYIAGKTLTFLDKGRNSFRYDSISGKVRCTVSAPAIWKNFYFGYRPSMVYFRGMQPEKRQFQ